MRIPLIGGSYTAKSIIASAQRCINLFPEKNPPDSPAPYTHYLTPGLDTLIEGPVTKPVRCTFRASDGQLFRVVGPNVYYVNTDFEDVLLGTIADATTPVSMADNGFAIILVDGTDKGYAIDLTAHTFGNIDPTNFYGGTKVDYLDTFFLLNRPGTNQWYISLTNSTYADLIAGTAFDALDIASKVGYPDPIQTLIAMHREVWLIGALTTEIWYNAGTPDFSFQTQPGAYIEHGTIAPYSVATQDLSVYWLSQDNEGQAMVMRGAGYTALRISTHAIEQEIQTYETITDAIGCCYQQNGHVFYVLIFPTANKTWVFDQSTELWHQRCWTDENGELDRHRINCCANAYGKIVVGDWENGNLYAFNTDTYTDDGNPISRIRSMPHLMNDNKRVVYDQFTADMQCGQIVDSSENPQVYLRWSDDRGQTYGNYVAQGLGQTGQYLRVLAWSRTGMARDRVYELMWSANAKTALNGAFIDITELET